MSSGERLTDPTGRQQAGSLDRRGFLGVAGAAGAAVLAAAPRRPAGSLSADERMMILQVARAGAVFPIEFPGFGEPGPAAARATTARLSGSAGRLCRTRLQLARAGSDTMIARGLLNQPRAHLLDGIGRLASEGTGQNELTAAVALAIGTVSRHFDPGSDEAALVWIGGLRRLHRRGATAGKDAR